MDNGRAEYLVRQYSDAILRIGYSWLGNIDDAKDICQTVLLKLLESEQRFSDCKQERAWVLRVAINACKDWKKSAWSRRRVSLDDAAGLCIQEPEAENDALLQAVGKLPAKYRRVIYMRYYEGYEVREIAAALGIPPALVSTHLARAKAKLKAILGDDYFE